MKNSWAVSWICLCSSLWGALLVWPGKPWFIPKAIKKHDRKSERILSGALKISSQLVQMSLSCKTWLISSFLFPTIHFHAKIIKREYFSSAPWKQPCHWLETVSRMLRIQQGTGFSSLLGLIWFPLLLFYWRITLMCFFLAKICTSCLCCIYYTVSILCVLSSVRNITIPYYTPYAFGKTTVAHIDTGICL